MVVLVMGIVVGQYDLFWRKTTYEARNRALVKAIVRGIYRGRMDDLLDRQHVVLGRQAYRSPRFDAEHSKAAQRQRRRHRIGY